MFNMDGHVYQMKKSRGINWTQDEKMYLVTLCSQRAVIIEEKKSDLITLSKKAAAWKAIFDKFSFRFGRKRTPIRIKEQWKRMKISARAHQRDQERLAAKSAGGQDSPGVTVSGNYGESDEIIAKVQMVLKAVASETTVPLGLEEPHESNSTDNSHCNTETSSMGQIFIKEEPIDSNDQLENDSSHLVQACTADNGVRMDTSDAAMTLQNHYAESEPTRQNARQTGGPRATDNAEHLHSAFYNTEHLQAENSHDFSDCTNRFNSNTSFGNSVLDFPSHPQNSNHSSAVYEMLADFARNEHKKKMEYLEREHRAKMEILKIERDIASAKLRQIEQRIRINSFDT